MLEQIFYAVLAASLSVSLILLPVLLLVPYLGKYYQPKVCCLIWMILALRLLVPIVPDEQAQIPIPVSSHPFYLQREEMPEPSVEAVSLPEITQEKKEDSKLREISFVEMLAVVWAGGTGVFFAGYGFVYLRMKRKIMRWSILICDEQTLAVFNQSIKECGIHREIRLYRCGIISTPMLMGFFRPTILLPDREIDEKQLYYVLQHEMIHYCRKDLWKKLLFLTAQGIHWFNPFIWMMGKQASADIEKACDAKVLEGRKDQIRSEYGMVILSFIQADRTRRIPLTTSFFEKKKQIVRRFETIMDTRKKRKGILLTALTVAVAVYSITLIGFVDVYAETIKGNKEVNPREDEAYLTQEEWKMVYNKDPEAYQERQKKFQQDILELYKEDDVGLQKGQMTWPLPGYYIIRSPYGFRYDGTDFHVGIDISDTVDVSVEEEGVFGEDVVAAADGKVVLAETEYTSGRGYGMYIILDHGNNLSTVYGHLSRIGVKEGDTVKAGQKIGEVGSTGFSTGPHLHFEIRENGILADPAAYLLANES